MTFDDEINLAAKHLIEVCSGRPCLASCLSRLRAAPVSCTRRAAKPDGIVWKILALAAAAVASIALLAEDVVCTWDGESQAYVCSGSGYRVIVEGGGSNVQTNGFGVCTNCTAIAPADLSSAMDSILSQIMHVRLELQDARQYAFSAGEEINATAESIRHDYYYSGESHAAANYHPMTNHYASVDTAQERAVTSMNLNTSNLLGQRFAVIANDAIYVYATNYELPSLLREHDNISHAIEQIDYIDNIGLRSLGDVAENVKSQANPCLSCGGGTNSVDGSQCAGSGNWCTVEQGDAITNLLDQISVYALGISNHCAQIHAHVEGLYRTFMTLRGGIPRESDLDASWQEIYLTDHTTSFDYGYTNIVERIELLLYGISGVGTNSDAFTSMDHPFYEDEDTAGQNAYDDVASSFDDTENAINASMQISSTLYDSLSRFVSVWRSFVGQQLNGNDQIIGSYSIEIAGASQQQFDVPALATSSDVSYANALSTLSRSCLSALYFLFAGVVGIKFYVWFLTMALRFIKWAWELLNSLFQ